MARGAEYLLEKILEALQGGSTVQVDTDNLEALVGAATDADYVGTETGTARSVISLLKGIKNLLYTAGTGLLVRLGAGTALIGKVGIDQTTQGTTNKVTTDVITTTPTIYNLTLTLANTEYSQALPANCRGWKFQCREEYTVRWSNVTGPVATPTAPWMTMKPGYPESSPPLNQAAAPSTLYFASPTAGAHVEIVAWT